MRRPWYRYNVQIDNGMWVELATESGAVHTFGTYEDCAREAWAYAERTGRPVEIVECDILGQTLEVCQ